jgi:hypothetical protein
MYTLKSDFLTLNDTNSILNGQNDNLKCALDTNKIKTLDLRHGCTLKNFS